MNEYKKLLKNSGIFALANLGSKFMSIILVPFYTYVLSTSQYGTIDMMITTISLLIPILTLTIYEGTLRFTVKSDFNKENIFTSSILVVLIGNIIFLLFFPVLRRMNIFEDYLLLFYLILIFQGFNTTFAQFCRGIGRVKVFAMNGIINTFITLVSNIVLLTYFNMGIKGYLLSVIFANSVCNVFLIVKSKLWKYISVSSIDCELIKEMLIYSIPLIPNALMWWIMNASDRYIVIFFLGVAANGIYAVSYKIPTILNIFNTVFIQAWQLSAIEESNSQNKSRFYNNVFNTFSLLMLIATSSILAFIRPLIELGISESFEQCWRYVPFLLVAVLFNSISNFLGTNYIAMKNTKGVLKTSIIGAIINIILNIILIPTIGLNGAGFATMISSFVVCVLRMIDTRQFVEIKLNYKIYILSFVVIFFQIFILLINLQSIITFIIELCSIILLCLFNKNNISVILKKKLR